MIMLKRVPIAFVPMTDDVAFPRSNASSFSSFVST
jgi:hypothetical protein